MRDRITINELDPELRRKIESISESQSYSKQEINNMISDINDRIDDLENKSSNVDLSNYYTKTECDVKVNQLVSSTIIDHNTDPNSHNNIASALSDLSNIISKLYIDTEVYTLSVTEDNQSVFRIEDESFIAKENTSSILIWNSVVVTDYKLQGRTVTLNSGIPLDSHLSIIILSIKGGV